MIGKRWLICSYLSIFLHFAIFANVFFEYIVAIENKSFMISSDNNNNIIGHDVTQLNCDDGLTSPVRLTHNRLLFTVPLDLPGHFIQLLPERLQALGHAGLQLLLLEDEACLEGLHAAIRALGDLFRLIQPAHQQSSRVST